MSGVVDDGDVVAVVLAFGPRKWHVMTPACTCYAGTYDCKGSRVAATYHAPTRRLARDDGIELNEGDVCGLCRRSLKVNRRCFSSSGQPVDNGQRERG